MSNDLRPTPRSTGRRALLMGSASGLLTVAGCARDPADDSTPPPAQTGTTPTSTPASATTPDPSRTTTASGQGTPPPSTTTPSKTTPPATTPSSPASPSPAAVQLPRGGRSIFPRYRVVAFYGTAGGGGLGVLGSEPPDEIAARIEKAARTFTTHGRTIQPAMELIVTIADRSPGAHGTYHHSLSPGVVDDYLQAARRHKMLLVLDLQPGHSRFLPLAQSWEKLLAEPDVGLALDAEWRMPNGNVPGRVIGHTSAAEVNRTTEWLADLVHRHRLPEKLVVLHQFTRTMIRDIDKIKKRRGLALVQHLDGFGSSADKIAKYDHLQRPQQFHLGFKLFYRQDTDLMSASRVLTLKPAPEYVSYQ